jgi:hypothetical protein
LSQRISRATLAVVAITQKNEKNEKKNVKKLFFSPAFLWSELTTTVPLYKTRVKQL